MSNDVILFYAIGWGIVVGFIGAVIVYNMVKRG